MARTCGHRRGSSSESHGSSARPHGGASFLTSVLRASSSLEVPALLGSLLDSLPIPVLLTDCSQLLRHLYGNPAWHSWVGAGPERLGGRPLAEVLEPWVADQLLFLLQRACTTGEAVRLRSSPFPGPAKELGRLGQTRIWDWEGHPLRDLGGQVTHLLVVILEGAEQRTDSWRSGTARSKLQPLSLREQQVAELVARGLSNAAIANRLFLSPTTVASHLARIMGKLGASSRVQVAVWVVEQRLFV